MRTRSDRRFTTAAAVVVCATAALVVASTRNLAGQAAQASPSLVIGSLAGRDNFDAYCAPCHGRSGRGDGPVAAELKTAPADLTTLARRNEGEFPRARVTELVTGTGAGVAAHGSSEMPLWGALFRSLDPSDARVTQRIGNVVGYIESIQVPSTGVKDLGSQLFRAHCAACHGAAGRGNGPMADQLRRVPPDLTHYTQRNGGVFPRDRVYRIVDGRDIASHGDREMPVWGDVFRGRPDRSGADAARARIEAIVRYLEGIQERAASLGRPDLRASHPAR